MIQLIERRILPLEPDNSAVNISSQAGLERHDNQ